MNEKGFVSEKGYNIENSHSTHGESGIPPSVEISNHS